MMQAVNFSGLSGESFKFERVGVEADWAQTPGVVLFAAPEGRGWRVIRVAEQGGTEGDIGTFWRWREARRYGATTVFVRSVKSVSERRDLAADLSAGLDPVFAEDCERLAA